MDELKHYGVVGMKWGVIKARKAATKQGVASRSKLSTGKHYDEVYTDMHKEKTKINKKYKPKYAKLIDDFAKNASDPEKLSRVVAENKRINSEYYKESKELVDKYMDRFNEATLKDINYKNIEKGKALLKKKNAFIFNVEL